MGVTEALKIKTAAKAYLGALAIAAQVALTYAPDHNTGWYTAVQGLVGALGVIGIFATPNKVTEAKQSADGIVAQVQDLLAQLKDAVTIVTPVTAQAAATPAPALTTVEAMAPNTEPPVLTVDAMAPAAPVLIPAPFTLPTTLEVQPAPEPVPEPAPVAAPDLGPAVETPDAPAAPATPAATTAP